ncbi:MAG: hypothetical protein SGBAC_008126 [Bacillariaceae sp.]
MLWSLQEYCASQHGINFKELTEASVQLIQSLNLPSTHPFCDADALPFEMEEVPPMGRLDHRFEGESMLQTVVTGLTMVLPALLAMGELWVRLFAGALGPLGVLMMGMCEFQRNQEKDTASKKFQWLCALSVASSLVLMTDTFYVLENGPYYGVAIFAASVILAGRVVFRHDLNRLGIFVAVMVMLGSHLVVDFETSSLNFGDKVDEVRIDEGMYFDSSNSFVSSIVQNWPEKYRTYSKAYGATSWMPSGDSRTGLPFLANHLPVPEWHRLFLETEDSEYVALDISFPETGFDSSKPIYMVLHGLNGGSAEEYIRDLTFRRTAEGATIIVMVARGLMDLPIRGWNLFNGARTMDAHTAAMAIRQATSSEQVIVGVGYSMGAIILNNYFASYGSEVPLDGGIALSGGLDLRFQEHFYRAQRLWQPMLAETARDDFFLGKWGHRVKARLSEENFLQLMRSKHITELDIAAVAPYSGYDDVLHYYREMSALGDMKHNADGTMSHDYKGKKIDSIAVPLVVLQALDDPLVTWRCTAANEGLMHPTNLVKTGNGNLMVLLTKAGGHVGWPVGTFFFQNKWKWMSDAVMGFAIAVQEAKLKKPVPSE